MFANNGLFSESFGQMTLKTGATGDLDNGGGDKIVDQLVLTSPDYVPEPNPSAEGVRQCKPV